MPVYTFSCEPCKVKFEILTIQAECDGIKCPRCGKKPKKTFARANFRIKGFNEKAHYYLKFNKNGGKNGKA